MKYQHIRHATGLLHYGNLNFLIDPMFAPKEVNPPIQSSWNDLKNPRQDLPFNAESIKIPEYCLVTHNHLDHFDNYADKLLPKNIKLLCQPSDYKFFLDKHYTNPIQIKDNIKISSTTIQRVDGKHGTGEIAVKMGSSSGYILSHPSEPTIYITGDTIFYNKVEETLKTYKPDVIIAFGGTAQFSQGNPITLSPEDLIRIHKILPNAHLICIHMDSINHCRTTRADLKRFLKSLITSDKMNNFIIPENGEVINL